MVLHSPAGRMGIRGGSFKATIEESEMLLGGDIILSLDNIVMDSEENLLSIRQHVAKLKKGDNYFTTILRNGQIIKLESFIE